MNRHSTAIAPPRSYQLIPDMRINSIGLTAGTHSHKHHQLLFGIQGQTQCALGHTEDIIDIGRCCAVPAGQRHAYEGSHRNSDVLVINIDRAGCLASLLGGSPTNPVLERLFDREQFISADPQLAQQVQALTQTLLAPVPNYLLQLHQITGLLLNLEKMLSVDTTIKDHSGKIAIQTLNQLIDAHLHQPLSVAEIAHHLRISESHFYALFLKEFGESPYQYALHRRLKWAKSMVCEGVLSITDIAFEVGFASASAFTRAFKHQFGQTPTQCQRDLQNVSH